MANIRSYVSLLWNSIYNTVVDYGVVGCPSFNIDDNWLDISHMMINSITRIDK